MFGLASDTFDRPDDLVHPKDPTDPAEIARVLYSRAYLLIRMIVGIIGILLPIVFIIGEAFLRGGLHVRGSLSAYYHTPMRDVFVAGLCVTGFLLATYMAGRSNWDFWLSFLAGVAVLGVAFLPTMRPNLLPDAPRCGTTPMPEGCSPFQQRFGEVPVARIHFACAVVFILSLAWICFLFARRDWDHPRGRNDVWAARVVFFCGWVILAAVAWAIVGALLKVTIWGLTPLYMAEVASVWAFGLSWLLKSRHLWAALCHAVPAVDDAAIARGAMNAEPTLEAGT